MTGRNVFFGTLAASVLAAGSSSAQLLIETFDTAGSSATFTAPAGTDTTGAASTDFTAEFGYDYSADAVPASGSSGGDGVFGQLVGEAPNTPIGAAATRGYRTSVNLTGTGSSVVIFTTADFSGDYEAQVDVYYMHDQNSGSTEDPTFAIATSGTLVPFYDTFFNSIPSDGYGMKTHGDIDTVTDWHFFEGNPAGGITTTGVTGLTWADSPTGDGATGRDAGSTTIFDGVNGWPTGETTTPGKAVRYAWTEVRMSHVGGVVSLYLNDALVATYNDPDDTFSAGGKVMLSHEDSFDGANTGNFMLFDNLIVTDLTPSSASNWPLYE